MTEEKLEAHCNKHRTRYWCNDEGNNGVQFRTDSDISKVWMCTNIGWLPISNAPEDELEAEKFAEEMAEGYGYEEADEAQAAHMAGW